MATKMTTKREYRCAICGRRLKQGRWILGRDLHVGNGKRPRYCWPGEGCSR